MEPAVETRTSTNYLNREPWFATLHILNSVGAGVNPVFSDLKVRLCKPVPLSVRTGYWHCLRESTDSDRDYGTTEPS